MGYLNESIVNYISETYPELKSLDVNLGDRQISFNTAEKVLPYLAYTNSLDSHNRLINIFHSQFSEHHKLIPFYIVLAICKREIKRFNTNIKPIDNGLVVKYKGGRYELMEMDIEKELVHLNSGLGQVKVPFIDFITSDVEAYHPSYKENYREAIDLIHKYRLSETKKINRIFNTPQYSDKQPQSGVIIFTPKVKFKELFNSLRINGQKILDKVPTKNAKYLHKEKKYKYDWISKTKSEHPLILFSNYQDIRAVNEFKMEYPYLDTLIFDEAEENYSKIEEVLTEYYSKLGKQGGLRDIYLLISDEKVDLIERIEEKVGKSHKWLATDYNLTSKPENHYKVKLITDPNYNKKFATAYDLRKQFRRLFTQFNPQVVIPLYTSFRDLIVRFSSYYSFDDFKSCAWQFLEDFEKFTQEYLKRGSSLYDDFIENVNECVLSLIDSDLNKKTEGVIKYLEEFNFDSSKNYRVGIVALNENGIDKSNLQNKLDRFPITVETISYSALKSGEKIKGLDLIFLLEFREPLSSTLFTNQFSEKQILILSKTEYEYYRWKHYKIGILINKITEYKNRRVILNLSEETAKDLISEKKIYDLNLANYVDNHEVLTEADESEITVNKPNEHGEVDFNDLIIEAYQTNIQSRRGENDYVYNGINHPNYLVIYRNGTQEMVYENHIFYKLDDEKINDINDLKKEAKDLKTGDEILKIRLDNTDLTDLFIQKLNESEDFREIYQQAEKWRQSLKFLYNRVGRKRTSRLISKYINRTETTIGHWYNGDTLVPQSHLKVINALNKIRRENEFYDMPIIFNPQKTKDSASTIKGIILKLPSILLKISIRKLYDLPKRFEFDKSIEELADNIYKHLDIKKIDLIQKI